MTTTTTRDELGGWIERQVDAVLSMMQLQGTLALSSFVDLACRLG